MGRILDGLAHYAARRNATVWARQDAPDTNYTGRNGAGKAAGLIALEAGDDARGRRVVRLAPITSRGAIATGCGIDVPFADLVALVDRLRGDEVADRVQKWRDAPSVA